MHTDLILGPARQLLQVLAVGVAVVVAVALGLVVLGVLVAAGCAPRKHNAPGEDPPGASDNELP